MTTDPHDQPRDCCTWRDATCSRPTPAEACDHAAERTQRFPWWPAHSIQWDGEAWRITAEADRWTNREAS